MRKCLIYTILMTMGFIGAFAQDNLHLQFQYRGSVAGAQYLPSTQTLPEHKVETSFQYSAYVANKSITYQSIRDIQTQNSLTTQEVDEIINQLDDDNKIGVGQNFLVFGFGLKTKIKGHPFAWSFTISDRLNANLHIPKKLVQLVWQGNKQFEGETLDLSKTSISGVYFREFSMGMATQVKEWNNWTCRGGMRLNYYMGLSGITNPTQKFLFTTAVEADYIEMDYNFHYLYTGIEDFNLFNPKGHGIGLNLGTTFSYKEKLHFDLGITDIGSIKFSKNITGIGDENTIHFKGLGLDELINPTAFLDSLEVLFTPEIDSLGQKSFNVPVGTRLSFMTSWFFGKTLLSHRQQALYFFYSQGFSEQASSTIQPKLTLAYHRPLFWHIDLGISSSWGGFNDFAIGAMVGMHFKHFNLSVQSDDLTGFILPDQATGAGLGVLFQVLF